MRNARGVRGIGSGGKNRATRGDAGSNGKAKYYFTQLDQHGGCLTPLDHPTSAFAPGDTPAESKSILIFGLVALCGCGLRCRLQVHPQAVARLVYGAGVFVGLSSFNRNWLAADRTFRLAWG